ncbi:3-hydroxyacyl-[acyl-carrier-protein] dehydratase [Nocardia tenerifensis]|uniref:3-hydroxyacyl-[acyl-carrier-protein] dehydratase n=1 Tax=Nocardia tenerifensis TaxID=228006 RepID=A0A318JMI9_9NOCA|nr:hypothetical protein [Nocardia tenerifensis]PXX55548.1 3-hydroxyacyl-[acyl-carrier-protein] dehydratase [Nocardia tenerifensis]
MTVPLPPGIDQIVALEPGVRAITMRNVPATLSVFDSHFPRFPVLPGVLVLDSMVATAALVVATPAQPWRLSSIGVVRFRHFIQPGDQVDIRAELLDGQTEFRVDASVADRVVATCRSLTLARLAVEALR